MPTIALRPAQPADIPAMADLLVQLYHAEIPGVLRGPRAGQRRLLGYILEQNSPAGLRDHVLAYADDGAILGMASIRRPGDPATNAPPDVALLALRLLGAGDTARLLLALLRSGLTPHTALPADSAYIYGVVVDARYRGHGVGAALMLGVEAEARQRGARTCQLRVMADNHGARRLYTRLGYCVVGRTPRWMDRLTYPTELMQKEIAAGPDAPAAHRL